MEALRRAVGRGPQGRRGELVGLAVLTAVLVASVLWRPADDGGFVLCAFRRLTGIPCMGCGLTRSFCAIAKGEVGRAAGFHPLGPALFVAAVVYWARGLAAVSGLGERVAAFDRAVVLLRLPLVAIVALTVVWILQLLLLGLDGRLAGLTHDGLLYRLFAPIV